jgi:hypothetical protein
MRAVTFVPDGPCELSVSEKCVAVADEPGVCGAVGPFGAHRAKSKLPAAPALYVHFSSVVAVENSNTAL